MFKVIQKELDSFCVEKEIKQLPNIIYLLVVKLIMSKDLVWFT